MDYIYLGRIVNTHGIKGEIRILSDFPYKSDVFLKGFKIYIGKEYVEEIIKTYRIHKNFDMITLDGINDINDVLKYKGKNVYVNRNDLNENYYFDEDYIGLQVYTDHFIGIITDIIKQPHQNLFVVKKENQKNLIPAIEPFILKIDKANKKMWIQDIEGLINEN